MKFSCLSLVVVSGAFASSVSAAPGPGDYVQRGLVALYDGVCNARNASGALVHDGAATSWANALTGAGDFVLPASGVTVGEKGLTFAQTTASAADCLAALSTGRITLEACVKSETPTASGNEKFFVELRNRAAIGYDGRSGKQFTHYVLTSGSYGSAKKKFYNCGNTPFADYAPNVHSVSWSSGNNVVGTIYADGVLFGSGSSFWTSDVVPAPDGTLVVGNAEITYTYNCVRVYDCELTADERKLNAAIDAVRFKGADPATVALPAGYSFDKDGNLVTPTSASEHRVTDVGTTTFTPPCAEAKTLVNASFGAVTFDESAAPVDADHAIAFAGFDALGGTATTFLGGWWDFGTGAFLPTDASLRTVTLDGGAVVTNVGAVTLANGEVGTCNKLSLAGEARLWATNVTLGAKDGEQHNDVEISGGASLNVSGDLKMSAYTAAANTGRTKNVVTVAGEGSSLTVGRNTYLSWVSSGYNGSTGGNTLYVTNGATASLGDVYLTQGLFFGGDDRAVFEDDVRVTTRNVYLANTWSSAGRGASETLFFVGAGAVVTNTESIQLGSYIGNSRNGQDTIELFISNGTFQTTTIYEGAKNYFYLLGGPRATLRLSGKDAKFTIGGRVSTYFVHPNNKIIIENGATYDMRTSGFNTTSPTEDETIHVRGGSTLNWPTGFTTTGVSKKSLRNKVIVEGDSKMNVKGSSNIPGTDCEVVIDDSEFITANAMAIGANNDDQSPSNAVLVIRGSHPKVEAAWVVSVRSNSCVRIDLPAAGYDAGFATSDTPVVRCGWGSGKMYFTVDATSRFELTGAQAMQDYHTEVGKRGEYVLVKSNHIYLPEGLLETVQAKLPEGMTLLLRNSNRELVLKVRPMRGMTLIVR